MFFKRPSFKYGGEAEGIKQTVRRKFEAGSNPNRSGNAFVKDIFETKPATNFNVMNQGIGQGLQMKQPSAAMGMAEFDDSYLKSVLQPKDQGVTADAGFEETGLGQTKEKVTSADVQSGKKEPPGFFGLKAEKPLSIGEIFQKGKGKAIIDREKEIQDEEERVQKAIAADVEREEKTFNPDDVVFSQNRIQEIQKKNQDTKPEVNIADEFADITLGSKQDEDTANKLLAGELKAKADDDPAKALDGEELNLANKEAESGLTGKFIPMFEKYLSPEAAEIKRDAFLAVAKAGFRLMNKSVAEAGIESVEDFEKIAKEKRQLKALAAMKGLDFEKDIMIADKKLKLQAMKLGELDSFEKKALELRQGLQSLYPNVSPTYIDGVAATVRVKGGTYNFSLDKEIYNDAATLLAAATGGQKVVGMNPKPYQYSIAQYAYIDPVLNVNTNLIEIPVDKNNKLDTSFQLEPGNFYFSKGLKNGKQVYTFKGNDNMIVGDTNKSSFTEYVSPIKGHVVR
jgi:hypothetical protein